MEAKLGSVCGLIAGMLTRAAEPRLDIVTIDDTIPDVFVLFVRSVKVGAVKLRLIFELVTTTDEIVEKLAGAAGVKKVLVKGIVVTFVEGLKLS